MDIKYVIVKLFHVPEEYREGFWYRIHGTYTEVTVETHYYDQTVRLTAVGYTWPVAKPVDPEFLKDFILSHYIADTTSAFFLRVLSGRATVIARIDQRFEWWSKPTLDNIVDVIGHYFSYEFSIPKLLVVLERAKEIGEANKTVRFFRSLWSSFRKYYELLADDMTTKAVELLKQKFAREFDDWMLYDEDWLREWVEY